MDQKRELATGNMQVGTFIAVVLTLLMQCLLLGLLVVMLKQQAELESRIAALEAAQVQPPPPRAPK